MQRRAVPIVEDPMIAVLYHIYHGECYEVLLDLPPNFLTARSRLATQLLFTPSGFVALHYSAVPLTTQLWNGLSAAVFLRLGYLQKSAISKDGNVPVAPLVLHRAVGGDDHLPSDDP